LGSAEIAEYIPIKASGVPIVMKRLIEIGFIKDVVIDGIKQRMIITDKSELP